MVLVRQPVGADMSRKPAASPLLSMSVLGGMSVNCAGHEIKLRSRKTQGLLAFLAIEGTPCSRDQLTGQFWSDVAEGNARVSLRQTLYQLRRELADRGYEGLTAEKLTVEIDRRTLQLDMHAVLHAAEVEHRAHPLLLSTPRLSEMLLAGYEDLDPSFQDWLRAKRQILHDRIVRGLEHGLHDQGSDNARKLELAEAILNLDPTHEEACRSQMRARAEQGDVAGALRVYKSLWDLLGAEYDMEPSTATQQLVADIKTGVFDTAAPPTPVRPMPAAPAATGKIALALDAFGIDGVSPDKVHLVQGFRHHLVASLVRFREWYVTDRFGQRGSPARLQEPYVEDPFGQRRASASGAPPASSQYDIQATAFQTETTLELVLTLKESSSDIYVWSDTFELVLERWFETQQKVVRRIATALNVNISQERLNRLSAQLDVSLDAYDRWLRGQAVITGFRSDKWKSAEQLFRDTIRAAPNFSSAYSSLAQISNLMHIAQPGVYRTRERERETIDLGRMAVRLDPLDSRAHLSLGWAYMMAKQYEQAPTHFDLACQLNDSDPWTLISASLAHSFSGSPERAQGLAKLAFDLSLVTSRTMWGYDVTSRFLWGDYEGCVGAARRASDVIVNLPAWTAAALHHLGRTEDARVEARRFADLACANWHGSTPATDAAIVNWVLHSFPISNRGDWERLRDGLRGAGLPDGGMDHHAW
jgi:DNA-binding SARP family transcriptional activator/TolB-like protein